MPTLVVSPKNLTFLLLLLIPSLCPQAAEAAGKTDEEGLRVSLMAFTHHLHRSLIAAKTTSPSTRTRLILSRRSLISASGLQPTMLQNGVLRNYNSLNLQSSPLSLGDKIERCTHIGCRKVRVSCPTKANHLRVLRFSTERIRSRISSVDGSSYALTTQSLHQLGFGNSLMPSNYFGRCLISYGPDINISSKRTFSHVPRAIINNKGSSPGDEQNIVKSSALNVVNKRSKRTKAIALQKDTGVIDSGKQLVEDSITDVSSGPSSSTATVSTDKKVLTATAKKKQPSRSKKSKVPASVGNAVSDEAAQPTGSEIVAPIKKRSSTKKTKASPTPENSSGTTTLEVPNTSSSISQLPKKKTAKPSKKGKAAKEAVPLVNGHSEPQVSSNCDLAHEQNPKLSGKIKLQEQKTLPSLFPPTGRSVVIVESATKAKVIQRYLGDMFEVIPSYGHVRDLAARSGSVRPDDDFRMVWEVPSAAWTHLKGIKVALSGADKLILASDPDREGEAIAWHILEMLQQQDALHEDILVARVVFNEITESSIKNALKAPRHIDENLVHAYLARRALDYLIGFNISPVLWRKLPGCQSAGRVQSAALSLISDREMEIDRFKPQEYWTVDVKFKNSEPVPESDPSSISSHLTQFDTTKLNQLSISSETEAKSIDKKIRSSEFVVVGSKRSTTRRNPPTPYITSTLQQDAANKLHFSAHYTMKLAQKLYEGVQMSDGNAVGLITYMRTDGLHISDEAANGIRDLVIERYGQNFAPESSRKYFKKVKNAQEAHEAIRPTDIRRLPSQLAGLLDEDSLGLYALIWARTMACQMEPTIINMIQVDIGNHDESIVLRSSCSGVEFPGFQAVYKDLEAKAIRYNENEGNDRSEAFKVLSELKKGDALFLGEVELKQHHTQPPARYSEGALVKRLEELGIGRPSTYASIMKVLQDRKYVTIKSRVLYPEFRGRMVSAFLSHHFSEVTDYSFTADMETELDNISGGLTEWKSLLGNYWTRFKNYCELTSTVHIHEVEKLLEKTFGDFLFSSLPDKNRTCPSCLEGELIFKVSRFGAGYFIGCDQHPKCKYIAKTLYGDDEDESAPRNNGAVEEPKLLGLHPGSNEKVLLKNGPYGYYVQLGEDRKGYLPKRASLSQIKVVSSITLEDALEMLRFPLTVGTHPQDGLPITVKIAKNGFAIKHRSSIAPVPKDLKPSEIKLEKALELLSGPNVKKSGRPKRGKVAAEEVVEALF